MDYIKIFYWLTVADNARSLFITMIVIFTIITIIATIGYFYHSNTQNYDGQTDSDKLGQAISRKWMWRSYPFLLLFWTLLIATPSKRDTLLILAGGSSLNYLINDKEGQKIPKEIQNLIVSELRVHAKDAKVKLDVLRTKEEAVQALKSLSKEKLLEKLKTNPELLKILLD